MTQTNHQIRKGGCHCGAVEFEINLPNGLGELRRCNCSLCSKKNAIMIGVPLRDLVVTKGQDKLALYQWNTKIAKHYFCSDCGIYTHHQRRTMPTEYGVNVACIDGVEEIKEDEIVMLNGAANSVVPS